MAGIAAVGSVGAGLSEAQFQTQYQVRVLKEQQQVLEDLGGAALELLQSALSSSSVRGEHDLDVLA